MWHYTSGGWGGQRINASEWWSVEVVCGGWKRKCIRGMAAKKEIRTYEGTGHRACFLFCFWVVFWTVVAVQRPSRRLHRRGLFFYPLTGTELGSQPSLTTRDRELVSVVKQTIKVAKRMTDWRLWEQLGTDFKANWKKIFKEVKLVREGEQARDEMVQIVNSQILNKLWTKLGENKGKKCGTTVRMWRSGDKCEGVIVPTAL